MADKPTFDVTSKFASQIMTLPRQGSLASPGVNTVQLGAFSDLIGTLWWIHFQATAETTGSDIAIWLEVKGPAVDSSVYRLLEVVQVPARSLPSPWAGKSVVINLDKPLRFGNELKGVWIGNSIAESIAGILHYSTL